MANAAKGFPATTITVCIPRMVWSRCTCVPHLYRSVEEFLTTMMGTVGSWDDRRFAMLLAETLNTIRCGWVRRCPRGCTAAAHVTCCTMSSVCRGTRAR